LQNCNKRIAECSDVLRYGLIGVSGRYPGR
jgi:hypothetical protein